MSDHDTEIDGPAMRAHWQARGPHWDNQADVMAEMAARLNEPLLEAADLEPGQTVLDLASGAGEPALTAAQRVGPDGRVVATDLVDEMLTGARRRAAAQGIGNMEFRLADMAALPFADVSFDRVICRFGIMFVPDAPAAVGEMRRVLKKGGRAALMVWGRREETTFFTVLAAAGRAVFGDDKRLDFDVPFRFGEPGRLADLFREAGFGEVDEREARFTPEAPVDRPFWVPQLHMSMGPCLETATEAERKALDEAIRRGFNAYRDGDVYKLRALARIVTATA